MTELLPCPFCGGKAQLTEVGNPYYWAKCTDCGAEGDGRYDWREDTPEGHELSKNDAIEHWNTRTFDARAVQRNSILVERLRCIEIIRGRGPHDSNNTIIDRILKAVV